MAGPFPTAIGSFSISGFGNLSVTTNVLLTSMTSVGTGIPNTPTVMNYHVLTGGGAAYIEIFGGTPSTTNGIPIEPGQTVSLIQKNPTLTRIISSGTSAVSAWW